MKFIAVSIIACLISVAAVAQKGIPDFRGKKWDTPFAEMSGDLVRDNNLTPGFKSYHKTDEDYNFAGAKAHTISYLFKRNVFYGVNIGYYDKDLETVAKNLTKKYGEPKHNVTPMLDNYEWVWDNTIMTLTKFNTGQEKNIALNIGKKRTGILY